MRFGYGWLAIVALGIGTVVGVATANAAQRRTFGTPEKVAKISNLDVRESSGVAPSREFPSEYFTHNDSGDSARFFRFNLKGEVTAEFALTNAKALDWEDMATAKLNGKNYVFLGDIGDNAEKRESIQIYRMLEPKISGKKQIDTYETFMLKYPDGPQNCEAFMVHPSGDFYLVTKVKQGSSRVYVLPAPKAAKAYTLTHLGTVEVGTAVPFSQSITAGDISPDGRNIILRTYTSAFEFAVPKNPRKWWSSSPTRIEMPIQDQGEAICYALDGKSLIITSEGKNCPIDRVKIGK